MARRTSTESSGLDHRTEAAIDLPAELVARVESRIAYSDFETADEYVEFVLEEVLERVEVTTDEDATTIDSREIADRLEALGYLE